MSVDRLEVVVPTTVDETDEVLTLESIPDDVPVHIERDGTLNEARNRGVSATESELVLVLDDDLVFDAYLLDEWAERVDETTLLGLADWDYGWIAGRVMAFQKRLWEDVGGFDERLRSHMGDTKFALDALSDGYDLERIPREVVYHEPHGRDISAWDHVWRGLYLATQHPMTAPYLARRMIA